MQCHRSTAQDEGRRLQNDRGSHNPLCLSCHNLSRFLKLRRVKQLSDAVNGIKSKVTEALRKSDFLAEEFNGNVDELIGLARDLMNTNWLVGQPSFTRMLCITRNGYIGMVPKKTEIGDVVVVLNGAQVPFVLRPALSVVDGWVEGSYQLVGECYVHGVMDGEAFGLGIKSEVFTII